MAALGMRGLIEAIRNLAVKPTGRTMATAASRAPLISHVPLTIHAFPTLEPLSLESWSAKHLYIPLRRDILHRAITYEADNARQGTASTKTRWDVHGSHRKVRPQKGTGHARAGTRQSPIFRGGGTVFGPHPRDFGTRLTRKAYDLAWRMALSYRYRRGELVVCQDGMEMRVPEDFSALRTMGFMEPELVDGYLRKQVVQLVEAHGWGLKKGRTLFVTDGIKETLFEAVGKAGDYAEALEVEGIDVKDLLASGRLVIEREALRRLIEEHSSDLESHVFINGQKATGPPLCKTIIA